MKKLKNITFSWEDGVYFDLWTLVHIMSTLLLGSALALFESELFLAFVIATILIVGWEILEWLLFIFMGIMYETSMNRAIDIIIGFFSFFLAYSILLESTAETKVLFFFVFLFFSIFLAFFGFADFFVRRNKR